MSTVTLAELKAYLDVTTSDNDGMLQQLLDGAEDEALMYMDRPALPRRGDTEVDELDSNDTEPATGSNVAPSVRAGIFLLAQAMFEAKDAAEMVLIRKAAETKFTPYRNQWGV